ncbi:hypothetical protein ACKKBF_B04130 [Auxenochlorella protothecoides x Auxenochlorella symbiontica]
MGVLRVCLVLLAVQIVAGRSGGFVVDSHDRSLLAAKKDWLHEWDEKTLVKAWDGFHSTVGSKKNGNGSSGGKIKKEKFDIDGWFGFLKGQHQAGPGKPTGGSKGPSSSKPEKEFSDFFKFLKTKWGKGKD